MAKRRPRNKNNGPVNVRRKGGGGRARDTFQDVWSTGVPQVDRDLMDNPTCNVRYEPQPNKRPGRFVTCGEPAISTRFAAGKTMRVCVKHMS
jgi:hypothetical protein